MNRGYRQEVFNVLLAQLLQDRGVITAPEAALSLPSKNARRLPDVIVDYLGLRTIIEGEVDDQPNATERVLESAHNRIKEGIVHIAVAIIYPAYLRKEQYKELKSRLSSCELKISVITESEATPFSNGNVDFLESCLRRAFDRLVEENVVVEAVRILEESIDKFSGMLASGQGNLDRVARILGIRELSQSNIEEELE